MIDCKECVEYAHSVLARGEIGVEDVNKLAVDRHVLKGCDTGQTIGYWYSSKMPMDIVCNGFSLKKLILQALNHYDGEENSHELIAQTILDVMTDKMRIKQGEL